MTIEQPKERRPNEDKARPLIGIGICACGRTEQLQTCLESIISANHPDNTDICIIVVDNNPANSAFPVVSSIQKRATCQIYYSVESRRGISYARNSVLAKANEYGVSTLAFIDDDEYVSADWLVNLWNYLRRSDADVVRGLVVTEYGPYTPEWIRKGAFFQRRSYTTGKRLKWANTGNVMFDYNKIVNHYDLSFDEAFSLSGGEDQDFFLRAHQMGAVICWVNNAAVYETLTKERSSARYYFTKEYRDANNRIRIISPNPLQRLSGIFTSLIKAAFLAAILPFTILGGRQRLIRGAGQVIKNIGRFTGYFNIACQHSECTPEKTER